MEWRKENYFTNAIVFSIDLSYVRNCNKAQKYFLFRAILQYIKYLYKSGEDFLVNLRKEKHKKARQITQVKENFKDDGSLGKYSHK